MKEASAAISQETFVHEVLATASDHPWQLMVKTNRIAVRTAINAHIVQHLKQILGDLPHLTPWVTNKRVLTDPQTLDVLCEGLIELLQPQLQRVDLMETVARYVAEMNPELKWAGAYCETRHYGGPEEGGWTYSEPTLMRRWAIEKPASGDWHAIARTLNAEALRDEEDRIEIEDWPGKAFFTFERPHYE